MPSDLDILRVLHEHGPAPVPLLELAERSGLAPDRMAVRMKSLVSLGYVVSVQGAEHAAYARAPSAIRQSHGQPCAAAPSVADLGPWVEERPRGDGAPRRRHRHPTPINGSASAGRAAVPPRGSSPVTAQGQGG
jgi:hypothetical protein